MRQRDLCHRCLKPRVTCYCGDVVSFRTREDLQMVILQHPLERKKTISTARMAHLCIENSRIISGNQFDGYAEVERLLSDPNHDCVILYPGLNSVNLSEDKGALDTLYRPGKKLVVFVIDGTWLKARQMMRRSENLQQLPQICFTPGQVSQYKFRKQPEEFCVSTIEAIHQVLAILDPKADASILLKLFNAMVEKQLEFAVNKPKKAESPSIRSELSQR